MTGPSVESSILFLAVAAGCVTFVSVRLVRALLPPDPLTRAVAGLLLGLAQVIAVSMVLAMFGILGRTNVMALHAGMAAITWVMAPSGRRSDTGRRRPSAGGAAVIGLGVVLAGLALMPTLLGRVSQEFETRHYHVAAVATWVQGGTLWDLPYQNPAFATATHPGDGELLGAWLALPTGGDELLYLGPLLFGILAVLSGALLGRRLGGSPWLGALSTIVILATPQIFMSSAHTLASDLAASAPLVAALVLVLVAAEDPSRRRLWLGLAGVGFGLAMGSKYTAAVPVAMALAWAAWRVRPRAALLAVLPGLALFAGPWFVRNWIATGNPVFPQGIDVLGLHLPGFTSPLESISPSIASHVLALDVPVILDWLGTGWRIWGPALLLLPVGIVAGLAARGRERRGLALLGLGAFVAYTVLPFTGPSLVMGSNQRYFLPALLIAGVVGVSGRRPLVTIGVVGAGLAVGFGYDLNLPVAEPRPDLALGGWTLAALAVGGLAFALWLRGPALSEWTRRRTAVVPAGVLAGATASVLAAILGLVALDGSAARSATSLQLAVERARDVVGDDTPFVLSGVFDLRSILGERLDLPIRGLPGGGAAGEAPQPDAAAFERAIEQADPEVIVVPAIDTVGVPPEWTPTAGEWCEVGGSDLATVYVEAAPGGGCPAGSVPVPPPPAPPVDPAPIPSVSPPPGG